MKAEKFLIFRFLLLITVLAFFSCQKNVADNKNLSVAQPSSSALPSPIVSVAPKIPLNAARQKSYSSIRKVDFDNFIYILPGDSYEKLELKHGAKERTEEEDGGNLGKIEYGDVTGDGLEEVLIRIAPETGGNCQCEMVFIYTLEDKHLKLLWSFDTWDRAEGGLKKLYAENNELVVETFGDNKFENDEWDFNFPKEMSGYCCPTAFTKIRFKWNGEKFVAQGQPELFDYDWRNPPKN